MFPEKLLWVVSVFAALAHNAGQMLVAVFVTGTPGIMIYILILAASGVCDRRIHRAGQHVPDPRRTQIRPRGQVASFHQYSIKEKEVNRMKRTKPLLALVLAAVMALSLAGCGTLMTDSVGALVQGNLDELYLGQYNEDFLQLVDITEAEAEQNYLDGLDVEAQFFAQYFLIENLTDDIKAEIVDLYKEIYSHSRYEVGEATEVDEDTYGVPVTIYPIDIMQSPL